MIAFVAFDNSHKIVHYLFHKIELPCHYWPIPCKNVMRAFTPDYTRSTIIHVYLVSQIHCCLLFLCVHTFASAVCKKDPPFSVITLRVFFAIEVKETNEHILCFRNIVWEHTEQCTPQSVCTPFTCLAVEPAFKYHRTKPKDNGEIRGCKRCYDNSRHYRCFSNISVNFLI